MALLTAPSQRPTPPARTDLGSQFNTQHRLLETLAVVLAGVLLAAPAAAIGLGIAWFVWRVVSPSKLTGLLFVAGGLLLLVVTNQDVLWLWPWGIFIPNRLFDILPPSSAVTIPAAILHSVEIEICVGPAVLVLFDQLMRVRETTLAGGVYRQARRGENGQAQYPGAMSPQAPIADRGHPRGGIRLGVDRDYQRRAFDLTAAELGLHAFLPGASGSGKTTTVGRIADGAMAAGFARDGDTVIVHSLDRLARNLDDLRRIVHELNGKGVRIEFVKEQLTFSGEDSPMANLLLSVMGAFAEFERALIRERQREGVALAKDRGAYKGRRPTLSEEKRNELRRRAAFGESKLQLAKEYRISRETVYQYLRMADQAEAKTGSQE